MELKRLSFKHKNNKFLYYLRNYVRQLIPSVYYRNQLESRLNELSSYDQKQILSRVSYYNKLESSQPISSCQKLSGLRAEKGLKPYFFDLYEYARYFDSNLKGHFLFGDISQIPEQPSLTKSRPISDENKNSVLLKWNKIRHFMFVNKDKDFMSKKDMLVWRGKVHSHQHQRTRFLELYQNHKLCNVGRVNSNELNVEWLRKRMTITEQLKYKFILSLEGNDVASNLKWVMSSNSIAVMPKPKFETWFMEGTLIPNHHYILVKDDYSDLAEKLTYYLNNPKESLGIIKNAHEHIEQFRDKRTEDLISLLVLKKYFEKTNLQSNSV